MLILQAIMPCAEEGLAMQDYGIVPGEHIPTYIFPLSL